MKKIFNYSIAVLAAVAAVSCAKELEIEQTGNVSGQENKIVFTLPASKTALDEGKTVWVEGDKILITDGTNSETLTVPEASAGSNTVELSTALSGKLYAIYPVAAAASTPVVEGQVSLVVPGNQDGMFASANICAAVSENYKMAMRNVTAVVSVDAAMGVDGLVLSAPEDALAGSFTVDLSGSDPVITKKSTTGVISVDAAGGGDTYYAAVIPGTYKAGFSLTALNLKGEFETKTTTAEKTLAINELADMGEIGDDMSGLEGSGTEGEPFQINNLAELTAFAYTVNLGKTYENEFVKVMNDIPGGLTVTAGFSAENCFQGVFDGDNHTITLNLNGVNGKDVNNYTALIGYAGNGAVIKNVMVDGNVTATGNYTAGVVGYCVGGTEKRDIITNCSSSATITGGTTAAGIAAYTGYTDVSGCINTGSVSAGINNAGISGYSYQSNFSNCKNDGAITATKDAGRVLILATGSHAMTYLDGSGSISYKTVPTYGVGGITGYAQNVYHENCINTGSVNGVSKAGGIAGTLYWAYTKNCENTGNITVSTDLAGGIVGWTYTNSWNNGDFNSGVITGRAAIGGIAGMVNAGISDSTVSVMNCENDGKVVSNIAGGVAKFYNYSFNNLSAAGGIVGIAADYKNGNGKRCAQLTNCVNNADVYGVGQAVGGIVGLREAPNNSVYDGFIDKCVNNGKVESALYRAGGIVGVCFDRMTSAKFTIRNCENHGTVKAPYVVGGIAGWSSTAYPASDTGYYERFENCYNDAEVLYVKDSYEETKGPYAGGIVGYAQQTLVNNSYNSGAVKPTQGEPNVYDGKLLGTTVGFLGKICNVDCMYAVAQEGVALYGSNTGGDRKVGVNVATCDDGGLFDSMITVKSQECTTLLEALNAWVAGVSTYYAWEEGAVLPVFVKE